MLALLESYKAGTIDAKTALEKLHAADYTDLGFAKLDHNRSLRGPRYAAKADAQRN